MIVADGRKRGTILCDRCDAVSGASREGWSIMSDVAGAWIKDFCAPCTVHLLKLLGPITQESTTHAS